MQNSSHNTQPHQHEMRENLIEDSPMVTIEYLRARLLSERSVSKAATERAEELAKRVKELEEQLKVVTLQRKRAEKATLEVLSYLESHGVSDISEVYESDSDQEDSSLESNVVRSGEGETFRSLEPEEIDRESLGSDHESTPSSVGSLSWKGRKKTIQPHEKKHFDSPTQRRSTFTLVNTSARHRRGKSCRQVKQREMRTLIEESRHDSKKSDAQNSSSLERLDHALESGSERLNRRVERGFSKVEVPVSFQHQAQDCDASSPNSRHGDNNKLQRTLEHKAQLKVLYEAQEKAQSDWEEKYAETNDSCKPGNHSYVTEEKVEHKEAAPHSNEIANCYGVQAGAETISQSKQPSVTHVDSFKVSTEHSDNHNSSQMQSLRSSSCDFAFPIMHSHLSLGHAEGQLLHSCGTNTSKPYSVNFNREHAFVPREEAHRPGEVLSALQQAKLLIRQRMSGLPKISESVRSAVENPISSAKDVDRLKGAVGFSGLFRVPVDVQSKVASPSRSPLSDNSLELINSNIYAKAPYFSNQYISSPMDSRLCTLTSDTVPSNPVYQIELGISAKPRVDIHSSTDAVLPGKNALTPYSSSPIRECGIPPLTNHLLYDHDATVPPGMYM